MTKRKQPKLKDEKTYGIVDFAKTVDTAIHNLNRLRGILTNAKPSEGKAEVLHRLKSISGYRRNTIKAMASLAGAFNAVDTIIAEMEG